MLVETMNPYKVRHVEPLTDHNAAWYGRYTSAEIRLRKPSLQVAFRDREIDRMSV